MKRVYIILFFVLTLFVRCSTNSSGGANNSNLLVKEVHTTTGSTFNQVFKYFYNGNKITSISAQVGTASFDQQYEYTGDLITKVSIYQYGEITNLGQYEYDNQNRLIKEIAKEYSQGGTDTRFYVYNTDGTITRTSYSESLNAPYQLYQTSKFYLNTDGQLVKIENLINGNWVTKTLATYTNYNSPLRNITGFNQINLYDDSKFGFNTYIQYNDDGTLYNSAQFQYTLNSSNYPTQRVQTTTNSDNSIRVTTFDITYY